MKLTSEQQSFVDIVVNERPRIICLTGGPGVGKTTTIRTLVQTLRQQGVPFAVAAPSGKAAQRATEALQGAADASTIHRLLMMRPEAGDYSPVGARVLVLDESSMIDVKLMATVMRAAFTAGGRVDTLVLVGDPDQLPPVGPGEPFLDLLAGTTLRPRVVNLTVVQRQALDSGIVRAAYAIKAGEEPEWARDFEFVACDELAEIPSTVLRVCEERAMNPFTSQILSPQKNTSGGCDAINTFIENTRKDAGPLLRGANDDGPERPFRVGSKVIHLKNDYQLNVFNGETGFVKRVERGGKPTHDVLEVELAGRERRTVIYRGGQIAMLRPAYALTVHKTQGSEYADVVLVAHGGHARMLTRSLLYVAATRARERVVVVGQKSAIARAVRTTLDTDRVTLLKRWLGVPAKPEKKAATA